MNRLLRYLSHNRRFLQICPHRTSPQLSAHPVRRLTAGEWNEVLIVSGAKETLVRRVRDGIVSDWAQTMLQLTSAQERVLEVGSGTGEISLTLSSCGRDVILLDMNVESLAFAAECASELGVLIRTVQADALRPLPFRDDLFDCCWSSGLLEHFSSAERQMILRNQARVTRGYIISLVPNAACVAYRAGKAYLEARGEWQYGLETPILSLRDDYVGAGLDVVKEYSVGVAHALTFLPPQHSLRRSLSAWFQGMPAEDLDTCNQGYLLVTVGLRKKT